MVNAVLQGSTDDFEAFCNNFKCSNEVKKVIMKNVDNMNNNLSLYNSTIEEFLNQIRNKLKLFCFSGYNNNILLWSHYSDNHKGVCIGFKVDLLQNSSCILFDETIMDIPSLGGSINYSPLFPVIYQKDMPPEYSILKDTAEKLFVFAKTKLRDWEYEKEYRLILQNNADNKRKYKFKKEILSSVVFGMKMVEKDKKVIKDIVDREYIKNGIDVKYFQANKIKGSYAISIDPI